MRWIAAWLIADRCHARALPSTGPGCIGHASQAIRHMQVQEQYGGQQQSRCLVQGAFLGQQMQ